jgi:hypothetical protein
MVRPRQETAERLIEAFAKAGLRFEPRLNGGFKMMVPNKALKPHIRNMVGQSSGRNLQRW